MRPSSAVHPFYDQQEGMDMTERIHDTGFNYALQRATYILCVCVFIALDFRDDLCESLFRQFFERYFPRRVQDVLRNKWDSLNATIEKVHASEHQETAYIVRCRR
jgi:hypothetical protein